MQEKIDFNYFDKITHNLEPISYHGYYAFLPSEYDDTLKQDLKIVFAKYMAGLKSFDYTKKRYLDTEQEPSTKNSYKILLNKITSSIWELIVDFYNSFNRLQLKEESNITLGLVSTFGRLINSYDASIFLLRNHYYFESISINRLIFEQINYCFNLVHISNDDFKTLSKKQIRQKLSSTDINKLKDFMPDAQIGPFYSYLSEITHIDYKQIGRYLNADESTNGFSITMKSIIQSIESALILLKIVDIHSLVYEYSFKDFADIDFKYLKAVENEYIFKSNRLSKQLIIEYNDDFEKLLKTEEIPIKYIDSRISVDDDDLPF